MFGFNKKDTTSDYDKIRILQKSIMDKHKEYFEWQESEEHKRYEHLQTLIIKTYESVNIKADLYGTRIAEDFTREDYIEDFKVFFKTEVFKELREWCKEYELYREKERKLLDEL